MDIRICVLGGLAAGALGAFAASAAPAPRTHTVEIAKMTFTPTLVTVRAGDTVVWVNHDIFRHTATANDGSFDIDLAPNASGKTVVKGAGMIAYSCTYHPGMAGKVVVKR